LADGGRPYKRPIDRWCRDLSDRQALGVAVVAGELDGATALLDAISAAD
jgi:hypothetical protein